MTPAATQVLTHRPLVGILYMCMASTLFPIMNGLVQVLSARYSAEQIVWARTAGHLVFVLAMFAPQFGWRILVTTQLKSQIVRSILLLMATLMFFIGVPHLQLAQAASISFLAPFVVVVLAWPILGERISLPRLLSVLVAFAGVLIVIRPGSDVFHWASLLILGNATCYALYQIFTRRVAGHDRPETSVIYSALVGTIVMSAVVGFTWRPVDTWMDLGLMCALGVLGALGHYCVAKAMTFAPANVVAPFMYWQMVGSVILGYLLWGTMPDWGTWLGATIIISAGLYIGWRETQERREPVPAARS